MLVASLGLALCSGACAARADSPSATVEAACAAAASKNVAAYKNTFSKERLADMGEAAGMGGISLDDYAGQLMSHVRCAAEPAAGAARIKGDTATLMVRDVDSDDIASFRFVREDGEWKFSK